MKLTARDKYLRKNFEITQAEFNRAFTKQGSVCKACGRPPKDRSLHTDHDHEVEDWAVEAKKIGDHKWLAWPKFGMGRLEFSSEGRTKPLARAAVKKVLKRLSVRGILCYPCNKGMKWYSDDPVRLHRLAEYLEEYDNFLIKLTDERNGFKE